MNNIQKNIKNHLLKYTFKRFGEYLYNKNFIVLEYIANRIDAKYVTDAEPILDITKSLEKLFFDFDHIQEILPVTRLNFIQKEIVPEDVGSIKYEYLWKTEHDTSEEHHYFDSTIIGWFLYRLNQMEKDLIYCGVRKVCDSNVLYIFLKGVPIFCIAETVLSQRVTCDFCGKTLKMDSTQSLDQIGNQQYHFCSKSCQDAKIKIVDPPFIKKHSLSDEVLSFAIDMEEVLKKGHEGDLSKCEYEELINLLKDGVETLSLAFVGRSIITEDVFSECANIGVFAMMLSKNFKEEIKFMTEGNKNE